MTHPDRRTYGGLDFRPPSVDETGPAKFDANYEADFEADFEADYTADVGAGYSPNEGTDFPADPVGPAAARRPLGART